MPSNRKLGGGRGVVEINLEGVDGIIRAMRDIGEDDKAVTKLLASATNFAMTPVLRMARSLVPRESGATEASLAKRTRKYPFRVRGCLPFG